MKLHGLLAPLVLLTMLLPAGCGSRSSVVEPSPRSMPAPALQPGWPAALPADGLQPWERGASGTTAPQINAAGVERFLEQGNVTDAGETSLLDSGALGERGLAAAIYRLGPYDQQPGVVGVDANLFRGADGRLGEYWIGLSSYDRSAWQWHGPFATARTVLSLPAGDYTSDLRNLFVCVLAFDGSRVRVAGIQTLLRDSATGTPEPVEGLTATPAVGGALLRWLPATDDAIVGVRVYYGGQPFSTASGNVQSLPALAEGTAAFVPDLEGTTYFRLAAVTAAGIESSLSAQASATPLPGTGQQLEVQVSPASAAEGDPVELTLEGGLLYDVDTDGDGDFDVRSSAATSFPVWTADSGIVRPRVLVRLPGGEVVGEARAAVVVTDTQRPTAVGSVTPTSGITPLELQFSGSGEDSDGTIVQYAWDFDGNGVYDWTSASSGNPSAYIAYNVGYYTARLRVIDDDNAWDVYPVGYYVLPDPENAAPIARLSLSTDVVNKDQTIMFDAEASLDPDGEVTAYDWDFDGDGTYDRTTTESMTGFAYVNSGVFYPRLRVTDAQGGASTTGAHVRVNAPPVGQFSLSGTEYSRGDSITVDISGSYDTDGTLKFYQWRVQGTFGWSSMSGSSGATRTFSSHGLPLGTSKLEFSVTDNDDALTMFPDAFAVRVYDLPQAALTASPSIGTPPLDVTLDASASTGGGTPIVNYAWDLDGDGTYELDTDAEPMVEHTFDDVAAVSVVVTNALGKTKSASTLVLASNWQRHAFAASTSAGSSSSLLEVDGHPAIAYAENSVLRYVRAAAPLGNSWNSPVDLGLAGYTQDLALIAGQPAIGFIDNQTRPSYVRATDAVGTAWSAPATASPLPCGWMNLLELGGLPTLLTTIFMAPPTPDICLLRAGDVQGSDWPDWPQLVESSESVYVAQYALIAGRPAVAYFSTNGFGVYFQRALDADGLDWNPPTLVDGESGSTLGLSLAEVNGLPAVATTINGLRYYRATDVDGTAWPDPMVWPESTAALDLAEIDGRPALATYRYVDANQVQYVTYREALDATGNAWGPSEGIDGMDSELPGLGLSLAEISGQPAVSYYFSSDVSGMGSTRDLRFARRSD